MSSEKVDEVGNEKKGYSEVMVRAVLSLYHGAKTKVRLGSKLSEEFVVQVCVHQGSVLSPLLFAIAVDVISENAREDILHANDFVIMSESIEKLSF